MAEQVKSAAPATREVRAPPAKTRRNPVIIEIIGGLLTAAAILFAVNGGLLFARNATLSLVAPAEIADAAQTLDPAVSGQLAEQAKESYPNWQTARAGGYHRVALGGSAEHSDHR